MFIPSFSCRSPIKVEVAITRSPHRSVTYGFSCWSPIKLEVVITTRTCSPFHSITYGFSCWSPIRVVVNNMVMVAPRLKELLFESPYIGTHFLFATNHYNDDGGTHGIDMFSFIHFLAQINETFHHQIFLFIFVVFLFFISIFVSNNLCSFSRQAQETQEPLWLL